MVEVSYQRITKYLKMGDNMKILSYDEYAKMQQFRTPTLDEIQAFKVIHNVDLLEMVNKIFKDEYERYVKRFNKLKRNL